MRPTRIIPRIALLASIVGNLFTQAPHAAGQSSSTSTASLVGGGVLGAYSGTVLGLVGAAGPCDRLLAGPTCPRTGALLGGAVGLAAGMVLGNNDSATLENHAKNAGYGAVAGGAVGLGLASLVRPYEWPDPLAFAAVGAAIGAAPKGSAVGFATGVVVGTLGWVAFPRLTAGDAITVAVVGLAVGGITEWVLEARDSRSGASSPLAVGFSVPLPIRTP